MALGSQQQQYGYADSRFENVVSENFHCPICLNVLKEPKMCRNNQHVFCSACIRRHLQNSSTCPQCLEQLTVETLSDVPRLVMNCLSELRIKCDFLTRGCRDFVQVGNLKSHVMNCGYAPVKCSNIGCNVEINKRDRVHHETELCDFRKVMCHECSEIRKEIDEVKMSLEEMRGRLIQIDQLKMNQAEMKEQLTQLSSRGEMRKEIDEMKKSQAEMKKNQAEMKEQLNQLPSLKNDIVDMKAMLVEVMKRMNNDQSNIPSASLVKPVAKQSIIIAGGFSLSSGELCELNSVQAFSWTKRSWSQLPAMQECRSEASCFVYQNQIMMTGGINGSDVSDGIEMLKVDKEPLEWITFPAKLPAELYGHKTVVYYDKLIVIGGNNSTAGCFSNVIYEVLLRPPYSTKVLCTMPQPVAYHGAELINDEIFILGGMKDYETEGIVDNVCVYDLIENKCKQMPALPYGVSAMSTVGCGNKVIVIGGKDRKDEVLNKVIMYDVVTGVSEMLPSMKHKRCSCSAVATADGMVVMGGENEEDWDLKSVEYFNFRSNCWQELPPMIEARTCACAVVTSVNIN